MKLLPPNHDFMGGADVSRATDATGALFVGAYTRPKGGAWAFRVLRLSNGAWSEIALPETPNARGEISVEGGRLFYAAWHTEGNTTYLCTGEVPGFAPLPTTGGGVVVQQSTIDQAARDVADVVARRLAETQATVAKLQERIKQLEARPIGGGMTTEQVKSIIWNERTMVDRGYVELRTEGSGWRAEVEGIARRVKAEQP